MGKTAVVLIIFSLALGSFYYFNYSKPIMESFESGIIVRKTTPMPTNTQELEQKINIIDISDNEKTSSDTPLPAGVCPNLEADPGMRNVFAQESGVSCGEIEKPEDFTDPTRVDSIERCLQNSLETCSQSKAYVFLQGFEGGVEYVVTTDNCKATVLRWGTTSPYCGMTSLSCSKLSEFFPAQVCDEVANVE